MVNCRCKELLESVIVECDWKDLGLMGLCVGSLGKLAGLVVPKKYKSAAAFGAGATFLVSAVALAVRAVEDARDSEFDEYEDFEEWEDWDDEEEGDDEDGFVMRITAEEPEEA